MLEADGGVGAEVVGERVVVRGKERAAPRVVNKVRQRRVGNGRAVKRRCSSPEFIQDHERTGRGLVENGCRFLPGHTW